MKSSLAGQHPHIQGAPFEITRCLTPSSEQDCRRGRPPHPLVNASPWARLLFLWPWPLLRLGVERPLTDADLADCVEADTSKFNLHYFTRLWQHEYERVRHSHSAKNKTPNLHRALVLDFWKRTWYVQPMMAAAAAAKIVQAVALGNLIDSFQGRPGNKDDYVGWIWATVLVVCGLIILFEHHHVFFNTWRAGMRYRIACVAAIYDKSLRLSSTHQDTSNSFGRIMNLASNDVERFLMASLFVNFLFWAPLQSLGILAAGCAILGPAFAAGFALLVGVFVPLQFYVSHQFGFYRSKIATLTDQRVNFVSQAVRGARVMKMSGYEWRFLERIQEFRRRETAQIARANRLKALNEAVFFASNVVVSLVIFLVHVWTSHILRPGDVFSVFTLVNILQLEMTKHVSLAVMSVSECYVSVCRIKRFLDFPELPRMAKATPDNVQASGSTDVNVALALGNVKCYWNEVSHLVVASPKGYDTETDTASSLYVALENISVEFRRASLTAVIGAVGSGKSALLQAIVEELPVASGTLMRNYHSMAYAAQDPFLMDGSVVENITMGLDFDQAWYDDVVEACGLLPDFQQLRDGDQTVVGDRGVQCSGGQRARIGLARTVYRNAEVVVLDDPLSAVDAKVGRQLFQDAIERLLVDRGKCVILATHQHQYLSDCRCLLMVAGQLEHVGSYDDCVAASRGKLTAYSADDAAFVDDLDIVKEPRTATNLQMLSNDDDANDDGSKNETNGEANMQGVVRFDTYWNYLQAMGGVWSGLGLFVTFCATQAAVLITLALIGRWAEQPGEAQDEWDMLVLVMGLTCVVVSLAVFRAFYMYALTIKASRTLHDRMAESVLRAKVEFFDTNPLGRIANRFSADCGSNDDLLPLTLFEVLVLSFIVVGSVIVTVSTIPYALVAIPFLAWYFVSVRRVFVSSSRELKRLEGMARSPIFALLSESLSGIDTIRANAATGYFREKFRQAHDSHTRSFFAYIAASRWVGFRMDAIVFMFVSIVAYLAVLFQTQNWFDIEPAILGLAISMLLQLAGLFQWCIRQSAEAVNQMVSVERVLQYGNLESEAALEVDGDKKLLAEGWPSRGSVEVQELSLRYRESLPLALNKVSFSIPEGSRVGIVGRTGSGKSTMVQAFFRLLEAEHGRILVDGEDISKVGLHALRSSIAVIPQSPTLFSGYTVRENIDPFGLKSDDDIRRVLRSCRLDEVVSELPLGWNTVVSEGGTNFSVGQRQLLCLARAILSKDRPKILILDEATASVDRRTDQLLHEALQETFNGGTIISVAHRLDTVIDNDYILVLGNGSVLEIGSPAELLSAKGAFFGMVTDTGDSMSAELHRLARNR